MQVGRELELSGEHWADEVESALREKPERRGVGTAMAPRWVDGDDSRGGRHQAVFREAGVVLKCRREPLKSKEKAVIISMTVLWARREKASAKYVSVLRQPIFWASF